MYFLKMYISYFNLVYFKSLWVHRTPAVRTTAQIGPYRYYIIRLAAKTRVNGWLNKKKEEERKTKVKKKEKERTKKRKKRERKEETNKQKQKNTQTINEKKNRQSGRY